MIHSRKKSESWRDAKTELSRPKMTSLERRTPMSPKKQQRAMGIMEEGPVLIIAVVAVRTLVAVMGLMVRMAESNLLS